MPIDKRTPLGQRLDVGKPVELDLSQFDKATGELIARRMEEKNESREEAILGVLNFAARLMVDTTVNLDTEAIFAGHPEVRRVVDEEIVTARSAGKTVTTARVVTKLIVRGAAATNAAKTSESSGRRSDSPLEDLTGGLTGLIGDLFGGRQKRT